MKLSEIQIENLYKFTRQHYVYHYDVQTELVDHLANDLEQICKEYPKITFEQARDKSFKKFGIFGFMDVVEKKQRQMTKKYFKVIFKFAKEWFRLPKIILTFFLLFAFYKIQELQNGYYIYATIYGVVIVLELIVLINNKRKAKQQFKITQKKWMFKDVIHMNGIGNSAIVFFYMFDFFLPNNTKDFLAMGDFRRVFSAILLTILVIFGYLTLVIIPKKAEQLLEETYPEYKLVKNL